MDFFKKSAVIFIYAGIVSIAFLIAGYPWVALIVFLAYSLYAYIKYVTDAKYYKKLDKLLTRSISEEHREMIFCHITKRAAKLPKPVIQGFISDINSGNYQVSSETLTKIHSEPAKEHDGGYTYYFEFDDNGKLYYVSDTEAQHFQVGDILWHIITAKHSARVMQTASGYRNLLSCYTLAEK